MNFEIHGPFDIPRLGNGLIARKGEQRDQFWDTVDDALDGLSDGCGCYVFALRNRGILPWYVGKAERQCFYDEVFQPQKLNYYDDVVASTKGTPVMFFLPKTTAKDKLAKPSRTEYPSVAFLENMLIGLALSRNSELCNVKGTRFLRDMKLPGLLTPVRGRRSSAVTQLREALGI